MHFLSLHPFCEAPLNSPSLLWSTATVQHTYACTGHVPLYTDITLSRLYMHVMLITIVYKALRKKPFRLIYVDWDSGPLNMDGRLTAIHVMPQLHATPKNKTGMYCVFLCIKAECGEEGSNYCTSNMFLLHCKCLYMYVCLYGGWECLVLISISCTHIHVHRSPVKAIRELAESSSS